MSTFSVRQAAKLVGVGQQTLYRWLWAGKVKPSITFPNTRGKVVRFTDKDIDKLRRYKAEHYWKGRGGHRRKKKGSR